jgi:hypothetical protein
VPKKQADEGFRQGSIPVKGGISLAKPVKYVVGGLVAIVSFGVSRPYVDGTAAVVAGTIAGILASFAVDLIAWWLRPPTRLQAPGKRPASPVETQAPDSDPAVVEDGAGITGDLPASGVPIGGAGPSVQTTAEEPSTPPATAEAQPADSLTYRQREREAMLHPGVLYIADGADRSIDLVRGFFERRGFEVSVAYDLSSVMVAMGKRRFDVAVCDKETDLSEDRSVQMIKGIDPTLPVIIYSSRVAALSDEEKRVLKADLYVGKGDAKDLVEAVEALAAGR